VKELRKGKSKGLWKFVKELRKGKSSDIDSLLNDFDSTESATNHINSIFASVFKPSVLGNTPLLTTTANKAGFKLVDVIDVIYVR
jgi:hypothetical protein